MQQITKAQLVDALEKSRALISIGWIKGSWAKNIEGKNVDPWSEDACKWCVEGAVLGATHFQDHDGQLASAAIRILQVANSEFTKDPMILNKIATGKAASGSKIDNYSVVPHINDDSATTHEQIIHLFDNAIRLAKHLKVKKN